ncbi:MAG: cytidine deaminase [Leptospirales bacterium]
MPTVRNVKDLTPEDRDLIHTAQIACSHAYAPYSNFKVGAAASLSGGEIRSGSNLENASYGLSICAEVSLLGTINSLGETDRIEKIAIACEPSHPVVDTYITPCGRCRQLLIELVSRVGHDIPVLMLSIDGRTVLLASCHDLLPFSFSEQMLGTLL